MPRAKQLPVPLFWCLAFFFPPLLLLWWDKKSVILQHKLPRFDRVGINEIEDILILVLIFFWSLLLVSWIPCTGWLEAVSLQNVYFLLFPTYDKSKCAKMHESSIRFLQKPQWKMNSAAAVFLWFWKLSRGYPLFLMYPFWMSLGSIFFLSGKLFESLSTILQPFKINWYCV